MASQPEFEQNLPRGAPQDALARDQQAGSEPLPRSTRSHELRLHARDGAGDLHAECFQDAVGAFDRDAAVLVSFVAGNL
jgi:hypothetical protein